jgi:hypothetical protein
MGGWFIVLHRGFRPRLGAGRTGEPFDLMIRNLTNQPVDYELRYAVLN